jgi:hypothetical protein
MTPSPTSPGNSSRLKTANIATLIFMVFSLLWLTLGLVALSGTALSPGSETLNLPLSFLAALAVMLLAARVRIAPIAVTAIGVLMLLTPGVAERLNHRNTLSQAQEQAVGIFGPEMIEGPPNELQNGPPFDMVILWVVILGAGATWWSRESFHRPWELLNFPGWVIQGFKGLMRKDRYATLRLCLGLIAMALLSILIVLLTLSHFHDRAVGKFLCGLLVLSAALACSALSLGEAEAD